jgi:hypothetical protein
MIDRFQRPSIQSKFGSVIPISMIISDFEEHAT